MTAGVAIDKLAWIVCQRQRGGRRPGHHKWINCTPSGSVTDGDIIGKKGGSEGALYLDSI